MRMEMSNKMKMKIDNGREYRDMQMSPVENQDMIVEGYATTFDEPYFLYQLDENTFVYEQILGSALDDADMSDVIMQYDHEGRVYARMSNNTLALIPDDHGLKIRGDLGGTRIGQDLYQEIKGGYTTKMSWGFSIVPNSDTVELMREEDDKQYYLRTITKVRKIYDVSAVSLPANNFTEISARKALDGEIKLLESERLARKIEEKRKQKKINALRELIEEMRG